MLTGAGWGADFSYYIGYIGSVNWYRICSLTFDTNNSVSIFYLINEDLLVDRRSIYLHLTKISERKCCSDFEVWRMWRRKERL